MNDLKNSLKDMQGKTHKITDAIVRHRFVIMIAIVSIAVSVALLKSNSYIDVPRNEQKYTEEIAKINYKKIDEEVLAEFKAAQQDSIIEIESNYDPNRENPFNE